MIVYASVGCQVVLLTVFATAGLGKIRSRSSWRDFVASVREVLPFPDRAAPACAALVVGGELAAAGAQVVPATAPAGMGLAAAMVTGFSVVICRTLRRGVRATCRCFGRTAVPLGRRHLVRNGLVAGTAVLGVVGHAVAGSVPPHPAGVAVAVAAGIAGAMLLIIFDEVAELFVGVPVEARQ